MKATAAFKKRVVVGDRAAKILVRICLLATFGVGTSSLKL
jgi:hypothetical protein